MDAIEHMKKLVFQFQNVIPNAHFVIELLEIVLKNSLMTFDKEYFQQCFGIIMGTNLAPIRNVTRRIEKEMHTGQKLK